MVGEMLPQLDIVLKDKDGNPVDTDNLDSLVVNLDGHDLKVWATVLEYAASQPVGASGFPEADYYYAVTADRINKAWSFPLVVLPVLAVAALVVIVVLVIRRIRQKKKHR